MWYTLHMQWLFREAKHTRNTHTQGKNPINYPTHNHPSNPSIFGDCSENFHIWLFLVNFPFSFRFIHSIAHIFKWKVAVCSARDRLGWWWSRVQVAFLSCHYIKSKMELLCGFLSLLSNIFFSFPFSFVLLHFCLLTFLMLAMVVILRFSHCLHSYHRT